MAYETGIAPQDLLEAPPEVFDAMCEHRAALIKQAAKKGRR